MKQGAAETESLNAEVAVIREAVRQAMRDNHSRYPVDSNEGMLNHGVGPVFLDLIAAQASLLVGSLVAEWYLNLKDGPTPEEAWQQADTATSIVRHHILDAFAEDPASYDRVRSWVLRRLFRQVDKKMDDAGTGVSQDDPAFGPAIKEHFIKFRFSEEYPPFVIELHNQYAAFLAGVYWEAVNADSRSPEAVKTFLRSGGQDTRDATTPATADPFAGRDLTLFASGGPAHGAVSALLRAHKWEIDETGHPRYVHELNGRNLKGTLVYQIVLPPSASGDDVQVAHAELAMEILKSMGMNTAWLHMLMLAYVPQGAQPVAIPRTSVYRALGLERRTDLTRQQKDRICFEEIRRLQSLGLSILRLSLSGKNLADYHRRTSPVWYLSLDEYGQMRFEAESGQITKHWDEWQVLVRPGEWASLFLDGAPMRTLGYMAQEMFEKLDRKRAPWSAALAILLTFRCRFSLAAEVPVSNAEIIEFAGGEVHPKKRQQKYEIRQRVLNAICEQPNWNWIPDYREWPDYLRPDLQADAADRMVAGDGSEAAANRLPNNYWDAFLKARTFFKVPQPLLEANRKAAGRRGVTAENRPALPPVLPTSSAVTLKTVRQQFGWTQEQMARQFGVSATMIRFMEQGKRAVSPAIQKKLEQMQSQP